MYVYVFMYVYICMNLLKNNLLRGGFRKNKSTTQTVFDLISEVANAKNNTGLYISTLPKPLIL